MTSNRSKPRGRRIRAAWQCPHHKVGYKTKREVRSDARRITKLYTWPITYYKCPTCRHWHLTGVKVPGSK